MFPKVYFKVILNISHLKLTKIAITPNNQLKIIMLLDKYFARVGYMKLKIFLATLLNPLIIKYTLKILSFRID